MPKHRRNYGNNRNRYNENESIFEPQPSSYWAEKIKGFLVKPFELFNMMADMSAPSMVTTTGEKIPTPPDTTTAPPQSQEQHERPEVIILEEEAEEESETACLDKKTEPWLASFGSEEDASFWRVCFVALVQSRDSSQFAHKTYIDTTVDLADHALKAYKARCGAINVEKKG